MIKPDDNLLDYVDDYVHGVLSDADARIVEQYCEKSRVGKVALEEAQRRYEALQSLPASEAGEKLIQTTVEKVKMYAERRTKMKKYFTRTVLFATAASVLIIGGLNLYYYRLAPTPYDLRLLGQDQLLAGSPASLRLTVLDHRSGLPVGGVPVEVTFANAESGEVVHLCRLNTDPSGGASPRFDLPDWPAGKYRLSVTARPGGRAERLTQTVELKREWQLMLSTDKPVYQPGQTIRIRSLALKRPQLKPVIGEEVTYSITDPKGNVIFRRTDLTSKFGIASADCPLATEINEGEYALECRVGDTKAERTVTVEKYVLPKFKLGISLDKPFYGPGGMVKGSVQADYFFGQPVSGGDVQIDVRDTVGRVAIASIETKTDATGKAEFDFRLPLQLFGRDRDGQARFELAAVVTDTAGQKYARLASRVVTTNPIQLEVMAEGGTLVSDLPNKIFVFASYADGRPAQVSVVVHGLNEELATNKLGVTSFELTPEPDAEQVGVTVKATDAEGLVGRKNVQLTCGRFAGDFLVRTDKSVYQGGDTVVFTALGGGVEPVFIDLIKDDQTMLTTSIEMRDGAGQFELDLPPELYGTIKMCVYRFGGSGLAVRKTRLIYVSQAKQLAVKATFDADEYRPGTKAKLKLALTDPQGNAAPGAISLSAVDEAVFSVLDQRPGMEGTFFLLEEDLLQPVYVIYPGWSPELFSELPLIERNDFQQAIFSQTSRVSVGAEALPADFAGPVGAEDETAEDEWSDKSMAEAAPFDPAAAQWEDESPFSLAAASYWDKVRNVQRTRMAGLEGVVIAWISLAGALVLVGIAGFAVFFPKPFLITLGVGCVLMCCGGPLIFIPTLWLTMAPGAHSDAVGMAWDDAAATDDEAAWEDAGAEMDMAMPMEAIPTDEPSSEAPMKAEAPTPGAAAAPRPRVRKFFPETLLWRPELVTNDQGEVEIEVELADSITTWRLSTSAVSGDGQLGAAEFPLRVFQPFFVDFNLPVALTRNDEVGVPVVVYNYLDEPQTVKLQLQEADWFERIDSTEDAERADGEAADGEPADSESADGESDDSETTDAPAPSDQAADGNVLTLELKPGEIRSLNFPLRVLKVGPHRLEVTATGSGVADAIRREIEVLSDGVRVEEIASGTLDTPFAADLVVPEDAIEGSVRGIVKIYPSTFSQLVEGLDAIFQMPHGCFEQTSSTTYPNVLALDYLRRTNKSVPQVEAKARQFIHVGYQRLVSFEVDGGGFDWFGNPPANRTLTAYGLMEFDDMAGVHDVDPKLIERTRRWLLRQRRSDGSWPNESGMIDDGLAGSVNRGKMMDLAATAYIGWAVFGHGQANSQAAATLDYLLAHPPASIDDPYLLALVVNAIAAIDKQNGELGSYLARLDEMKQTSQDEKQAWWQKDAGGPTTFYGSGRAGDIETTAMATLALLEAGQYPGTARGALSWLVAQKDANGTWHSTQATILSLKALLAGSEAPLGGDTQRRIEVAIGGEIIHEFLIPADQADVLQQFNLSHALTPGNTYPLTISDRTDTGTGYQLTFRYHLDQSPSEEPAEPGPLSVDIAYDRDRLQVDETVAVVATITNNMDEAAPMVILDLPIPGGFAIEPGELAELVGSQKIARYQITARQAIVYLRELPPGQTLELRYRLKATMPVKVTVPEAQAYEYYDPDTRGNGGATRLEVVEA